MSRCLGLHHLIAASLVLLLSACGGNQSSHPKEAEVRKFLEGYFSSWSAQDMDAYGNCFHAQARVTYLPDGDREPRTDSLTDFLYGQRMGHKTSPEPMVEIPLSMQIQMGDRAAQGMVDWQLTKGDDVTKGTDFFNLILTSKGWKITNLVFYSE